MLSSLSEYNCHETPEQVDLSYDQNETYWKTVIYDQEWFVCYYKRGNAMSILSEGLYLVHTGICPYM